MLVVLGHRSDELAAHLADTGATVVINEHYREGMLSSIQAGIRAAPPDAERFVIALGDQPSIRPGVVSTLLAAAERGAGIVVPSYGSRRGHPVVLDARYREEILALDPQVGLRELLQRHAAEVGHVTIDDEAVLSDMDTPEDYQRELFRLGARSEG